MIIIGEEKAQGYGARAPGGRVWAGLMATFCRTGGLSVELIDAEAEELTAEQVAERVAHLNPVLAAVVVYGHQPSASTQSAAPGRAARICTVESPMLAPTSMN